MVSSKTQAPNALIPRANERKEVIIYFEEERKGEMIQYGQNCQMSTASNIQMLSGGVCMRSRMGKRE
jgi:hypothetical protein